MQTTTLVRPTADVVTIVSLRPGDVYKRLDKDYSGTKLFFGIVRDVLHNGEDAVITALEFSATFNGVEPALKVFGTNDDLKLFPAEPEEVRTHFAELRASAVKAVERAQNDLATKTEIAEQVGRIIHNSAELAAPETVRVIDA